jgi:UDP-N-acetylglucosamine transferase subunit ALG13
VTADGATGAVFATVGTDHHPFDRLIRWLDAWLEAGDRPPASCFVQHGASAVPGRALHAPYLGYDEMDTAVRGAPAVVCHGGPGSIMLATYHGKRPIVVARRKELGEHVDDHQVLFTRRLAEAGEIDLVESEEELGLLLDARLEGAVEIAGSRSRDVVQESVRYFEERVAALLSTDRDGRVGWLRPRHRPL